MTITDAQIETAIRVTLDAAPDGARVIFYGSQANGAARPDSDLDLMVVCPATGNGSLQHHEITRLTAAIKPLDFPIEIHVMGRGLFDEQLNMPGSVPHEAAKHGRIFSKE